MAVAAAWWSAPRPPQSDDSGSSKEGTIMRKLLAALCLLAASQSPAWAKSAPAGVWLFDDAPDYPGVTMLELAVDDGAISGSVTTLWRSEEHTSELQSLMRISYAVLCLKNN